MVGYIVLEGIGTPTGLLGVVEEAQLAHRHCPLQSREGEVWQRLALLVALLRPPKREGRL